MYQRALQGYEKARGPEHTSTLGTVNNLGNLYAEQGKLDKAEQMYQQALQGFKSALSTDNIMTYPPALRTIQNLGSLFESQGNVTKARAMYSDAFIGSEKVFGPDHSRFRQLQDKSRTLDTMIEEGLDGRETAG
jgi:tetratricopeptide (TPR) repeat protein